MPTSLKYLYINGNKNIKLCTLPNTLQKLLCSNCELTSLPTLPSNLEILNCSHNKLTSLPTIPKKLKSLDIEDNNINILPSSIIYILDNNNNTDHGLEYRDNPICKKIKRTYTFTDDLGNITHRHYTKFELLIKMIKSVRIIEEWFLKIRYDPQYIFCRKCVHREYDKYNDNKSS